MSSFSKYFSVCILALVTSPAFADCSDVIKLSMNSTNIALSNEDFSRRASDFCKIKEEDRNRSGSGKIGFTGKFKLSIGGSAATSTQMRDLFCKNDDSSSAKENAYSIYIEQIAPRAYSSYEQCINAKNSFKVKIGSSTPTYVPITVNFIPQVADEYASIKVNTDPSIECELKEPIVLEKPGSFTFACTRKTVNSVGSINVTNLSGTQGNLSVPWQAYNPETGAPVDLEREMSEAISEILSLKKSLSGAVIGFHSEKCPAGFKPYEPAHGRFLRGIDPQGKIDTANRQPGSIQDDMFKSHTHKSAVSVNRTGYPDGSGDSSNGPHPHNQYWRGNRDLSLNHSHRTTGSGGNETRPDNVAVTFCTTDF